MLRLFLILQILFFSVNVFCQINQRDSLGNKIGLWVKYDIEHIKLSETMYVNNEVEYTHYYTRKGDTIYVYDWKIEVSIINQIREHILENFVINEFTEVSGIEPLLLILDFENNVYEIRTMRGMTQGFNKELLRVINKIEKQLIVICVSDCQTPIVTPFAIRFNK